jgi:predicted metalloprotease with PDZ domain
MSIVYTIVPSHPEAHLFTVTCKVEQPSPCGQQFQMPAWIPGSYMIRDFAKNVVEVRAQSQGKPITIKKTDKSTWQCAPCDGELTITYDVYAWDLSVRAAHCDQTHAYFNGSSVFMMAIGQEQSPCIVDIQKPRGDCYQDWKVATALPTTTTKRYEFGEYIAQDYDELIDHPVEMGAFNLLTFEACGVKHDVAITGQHQVDGQRLCEDLKKICETQIRFFGEPAPMNYYLFLVMAVGEGYGGLEHRASTSLLCSRDDLPKPNNTKMTDSYRNFLALCSHEYFHTWNVKRIKPAVFIPYDLTKETHTPLLWAFEGITSYYDELMLYRSGVIDKKSYLEMLGETITRVLRSLGRFKQTVTESSFDAWTKLYKADENAPNAIVSYYTKGAYVALALDLTLRNITQNKISLDEVMRRLWQRFGLTGQGVEEAQVMQVCEELSGMKLGDFFDRALYSTQDLPIAELLAQASVKMTVRPAESFNDKGGKPSTSTLEALVARPDLGVRITAQDDGMLLTAVLDGSAAQQAGLSAGDVIIAVNGLRITAANFEKQLSVYCVGEKIQVHAFRRDELGEYTVILQSPRLDTCELSMIDEQPSTMWL